MGAWMQRDEEFIELELLRMLHECIPGFRVEIEDPQVEDLAVALVTKQNERWNAIFDWIDTKPTTRHYTNVLRETLDRSSEASTFRNGSTATIDRQFPLVVRPLDGDIARLVRMFPGITLAYVLSKCEGIIAPNVVGEVRDSLFSLYAGEYQVLKQTASDLNRNKRLSEALDEVERLRTYAHEAKKAISAIEVNAATQIQNFEWESEKRRLAWDAEKSAFLSGLRREAEEAVKIEASIDLWDTKSKSHNIAFWVGLGVFCFLGLPGIEWVIPRHHNGGSMQERTLRRRYSWSRNP
jgi:hypothetical protein